MRTNTHTHVHTHVRTIVSVEKTNNKLGSIAAHIFFGPWFHLIIMDIDTMQMGDQDRR